MAKLKVPSLQHLARNWRDDPNRVRRVLVHLANNSPTFNYNVLFSAVRDMLLFGQPFDQIAEGIRRAVRRKDVRENYLEVLPLISDHFDGISPDFVQTVERRYYPIARELMVPFDPPLLYGIGGRLFFPWFSFWRGNPLTAKRLELFVSVVDDVLLQDPDLEQATFEILDFSAPKVGQPRELSIVDAKLISRVSEADKREMLAIFAEGYFLAQAELARAPSSKNEEERRDNDHPNLFGEDF